MSRIILEQLRKDALDGKLMERTRITDLKTAVVEFLKEKFLEPGISFHTVRTYYSDLVGFIHYSAHKLDRVADGELMSIPLDDMSRHFISAYLIQVKELPRYAGTEREDRCTLSEHTILKKYRSLRAFFSWLSNEEILDFNPMSKVKPPAVGDTMVSVWPFECLVKFLESFDRADFRGERDYLIAITLIDTALRVGEIAGIRDSDIDWDGNIIKVYGKKKDRHVVFSKNLAGELHKWIRRKNEFALQLKRNLLSRRTYETMDTTITFPALGLNGCRWGPLTANAISHMISEHAEMAGVPAGLKKGPHSLRHTAATHLAREGVNSFKLQRFLGHSRVTTSEIYTRIDHQDIANELNQKGLLGDLLSKVKEKRKPSLDDVLAGRIKSSNILIQSK
ncbi:tyrosine-type recombinase/integrase [Pelotomaculum propionicicum]|uniref:Tyrosine recombinase XerC n=1 Tax=Pelotomaculum propionicicum TaxID=258475 RepID=A0A4Y7RJA8_9FIRM|nr:site-specific integrase [Pelotomaculum propionicicum]TEB09074.1 Tyrosine recombinase XerC [Pelotomaculum propionicicum]